MLLRSIVALLPLALAAQQPHDTVISGGRIYDGAGNPWFYADVAVQGDRIAAIGNLAAAAARMRLDARGLAIVPGFIDIHSHGRDGLLTIPAAENQIRQGVTTIVEGNDGGSPLPLAPFLAKLAATRFAVNFATFAGHGTIRREVVGLENRKATPEEIQKMKDLTRQAMRDGSFGLSTGLFYVPGNYAPTEEVIELAKVAGSLGGMHISHMRNEAQGVLDSIRETIRIGEEGGLPTQITHHKVVGTAMWGKSVETLRLVEQARARGVDVTIDQYPYTASSTGTAALFPQWAQAGGTKSLLERLDAPETRARIKEAIVSNIVDNRGGGDPKNVVLASCRFDPALAGMSLADVTAARGVPVTVANAAETAIEIQKKGGCSAIYHAIAEPDVERILKSPYTMVASDGGVPEFGRAVPHPRNYGAFARVLGRYVRERRVITLESAIHKMSGFPAARLKLMDRGLIAVGMKADIGAFDPATVIDKAEFGKPHQYAEGFRHVLVNGRAVLRDGKMTGELPGRVLYG
ncbi:MAG: N-acyl-D-amino-acid deacylase family protein, partial [Bryobacteraceae bacterium]